MVAFSSRGPHAIDKISNVSSTSGYLDETFIFGPGRLSQTVGHVQVCSI